MRTSKTFASLFLAFVLFGAGLSAQTLKPRDYTARLVGHAHIDLSWLWRWEESVHDVAVETFKGTLLQMNRMPGLTFAQSQAAIYEVIEKDYPELFQAIKAKIKEGTWVPVGGMWVEPDLNMPDGEALARQLLYGKRYFLEKFGVDVKVGWNPDSFGHNWQLPQILARAGLKYYVFGRCAPAKMPAFVWRGKDGSELLSYVPQGWYNVGLKNGIKDVVLEAAKISPLKDVMILYGEGDHGGGPRDSDLEAIRRFGKDKNQPRLEFVTPEAYFKILERQKAELPSFNDELNFTFPACYTTQAETKKNNRKAEALLVSAEKFSALSVALGLRDYYPERDIDEAWKIVLRNQFHDILDGSSIGPVYDEVRDFYKTAMDRGRRALDFSLETITNDIDTRGEGIPVVVFNPLAWERTEPVVCRVPRLGTSGAFKLAEADGPEIPFQILPESAPGAPSAVRLVFIAGRVPSLGYKMFRVLPVEQAPVFKTALAAGADGLENEFFKLRIDPKTGWLAGIFDKTNGREVLQGPGNVLQAILDEPQNMSAWELGLKEQVGSVGQDGARITLVESGPVRAVIRVQSRFRRSSFTQDIILYAGVPRIDFRTGLNWQERNLMIKAAFPLNLKADKAEFEIPYGSISRKTDGTEVPAIRWADATDESGGFGVGLLNDRKYGYDIKGSILRLSVIHGATYPDPEADRGPHELFYSLYPHRGDWKEAQTARRGYEFNNPLLPRAAMSHPGTMPASRAFVTVGPENVFLSALKKETGYYGRGLILRVYEAYGRKTEARIEFPWPVTSVETDLIERPLAKEEGSGTALTLTLNPYEIKTVRVLKKENR
jgi:alpha-mannosidase